MKKSAIYELAIKLGGLYLFFFSITLLKDFLVSAIIYFESRNSFSGDFDGNNFSMMLAGFSNLSITIAFAFFLTFHTEKIVNKICSYKEFEDTVEIKTNKTGLYEMALVLSGLMLIIFMLPEFVVRIKDYWYLTEHDYQVNYLDKGLLWVAGVKIVLGVLIIAGAEMISLILVKEKNEDIDI